MDVWCRFFWNRFQNRFVPPVSPRRARLRQRRLQEFKKSDKLSGEQVMSIDIGLIEINAPLGFTPN
jgi:hypothetical protein